MNNEIKEPKCRKCGGDTILDYRKSTGMDIEPTGLFAECMRCGFEERIKILDEKEI